MLVFSGGDSLSVFTPKHLCVSFAEAYGSSLRLFHDSERDLYSSGCVGDPGMVHLGSPALSQSPPLDWHSGSWFLEVVPLAQAALGLSSGPWLAGPALSLEML